MATTLTLQFLTLVLFFFMVIHLYSWRGRDIILNFSYLVQISQREGNKISQKQILTLLQLMDMGGFDMAILNALFI